MVSFSGDAVFQPIHKNIRAPDRDAPAVVGVVRFCPVCNCGETSYGVCQRLPINGKSGDIRDLFKVSDDRSVKIHIAVFVNDKDIRLRGSIVLVRTKTDITPYLGIGDGDQTGPGQGDVDFLLIPL